MYPGEAVGPAPAMPTLWTRRAPSSLGRSDGPVIVLLLSNLLEAGLVFEVLPLKRFRYRTTENIDFALCYKIEKNEILGGHTPPSGYQASPTRAGASSLPATCDWRRHRFCEYVFGCSISILFILSLSFYELVKMHSAPNFCFSNRSQHQIFGLFPNIFVNAVLIP